jgi:hypothetical protein
MLFRFAQRRYRNYSRNAGWSSLVARQAHNLKAAGSNPAPATNFLEAAWAIPMLSGQIIGSCFKRVATQIYARDFFDTAIQRSSVVERSAVNRLVVGSNPTAGAKLHLSVIAVDVP